jgi:hypothetical protein
MISSIQQCQVMKPAMRVAKMAPEVMVTEIDLSKVYTRWRTVAVAISIESSSPIFVLVGVIFYVSSENKEFVLDLKQDIAV